MKFNFSVGDIVTGTEYSDHMYTYTNSSAIMEVVKIFGDSRIRVKVLKGDTRGTFDVDCKYFKHAFAVEII